MVLPILLFSQAAVPSFTLCMGCISVFNLIMNYNDMISMNNILRITLGWAGAILGQLSDDVIRFGR